ncbi:MAG: RHS repeat-associated core domain-containing protein [Thermoanaerobaculia bacterium]
MDTNVQGPRGRLSYQYNPDDTVLSYAVQGGPSASYTYYPSGALDTIAWTPVSVFFKYAYTLNGQYHTIAMPNGQRRNYSYDDQGRLLQLANLHPSAGNLATYAYGYDLNNATGQYTMLGQRVSMTATVPSQGFSGALTDYNYDQSYQLIQAAYPNAAPFNGEVDSWSYDSIGNRLANVVNGISQNYTYLKNGSNPLNGQRLSNDGSNAYTYDANGSTLAESGTIGNFTFAWDVVNRRIGSSGDILVAYGYDYQGRRLSKTISGSKTDYLYSGLDLIRDSGPSSADYIVGPGVDEPLAVAKNGIVSYVDVDALGTVTEMGDSRGVITHAVVFDGWGNVRAEVGTRFQPFTYAGHETDEAGLLFYRARYFATAIGRFGGEDPLDHHGASKYAYASNSPIRLRDPFGLEVEGPVLGPPPIIPIINPIINGPYFPFWPSPYGGGEFYFHGNYGGPGWSGGSWTPGGGENMPPWGGAPPKDPEDQCYAIHDSCYSNCRKHSANCPSGECPCTRACDLALAVCLRGISGGGIRVAATAAFFDFHGHLPCWR